MSFAYCSFNSDIGIYMYTNIPFQLMEDYHRGLIGQIVQSCVVPEVTLGHVPAPTLLLYMVDKIVWGIWSKLRIATVFHVQVKKYTLKKN